MEKPSTTVAAPAPSAHAWPPDLPDDDSMQEFLRTLDLVRQDSDELFEQNLKNTTDTRESLLREAELLEAEPWPIPPPAPPGRRPDYWDSEEALTDAMHFPYIPSVPNAHKLPYLVPPAGAPQGYQLHRDMAYAETLLEFARQPPKPPHMDPPPTPTQKYEKPALVPATPPDPDDKEDDDSPTQASTSHLTDTSSMAAPVLIANATYRTPLLPLSSRMPHARFPIGNDFNDATLSVMLDTGAGCNLGRKAYHMSIYERCPDLVVSVESVTNNEEWNDIPVGSIEEQGTPVMVTSVIIYKTPFVTDGHPVQLRIGLAETAAINTILGITFLESCKAALHFCGSSATNHQLVCPRLGHNLPVLMQPPRCSNEPDNVETPDRRSSLSFVASPEVKNGLVVSSDAEALVNPEMHSQPPKDGDDFLMLDLN